MKTLTLRKSNKKTSINNIIIVTPSEKTLSPTKQLAKLLKHRYIWNLNKTTNGNAISSNSKLNVYQALQ